MEGEAHSHRNKHTSIIASNRKRILQTNESYDDADQSTHFVFKSNNSLSRFLFVHSQEKKAVTSLSYFVIEKQIKSFIGTQKTLLIEACRKSQMDQLFKISTFFWTQSLCLGAQKA